MGAVRIHTGFLSYLRVRSSLFFFVTATVYNTPKRQSFRSIVRWIFSIFESYRSDVRNVLETLNANCGEQPGRSRRSATGSVRAKPLRASTLGATRRSHADSRAISVPPRSGLFSQAKLKASVNIQRSNRLERRRIRDGRERCRTASAGEKCAEVAPNTQSGHRYLGRSIFLKKFEKLFFNDIISVVLR